jgi:hypothetical protein
MSTSPLHVLVQEKKKKKKKKSNKPAHCEIFKDTAGTLSNLSSAPLARSRFGQNEREKKRDGGGASPKHLEWAASCLYKGVVGGSRQKNSQTSKSTGNKNARKKKKKSNGETKRERICGLAAQFFEVIQT